MRPCRGRGAVYCIPPWSTRRQFSQSPPSPPDSEGGGLAGYGLGASATGAREARGVGRVGCPSLGPAGAGQAHRGQDFPDGVVGLDQGYETQRALAARTRYVNLEHMAEEVTPRNVVRKRQGSRGLVFFLGRRDGHGGRHHLAAEAAM
jgi:hypothetical protein